MGQLVSTSTPAVVRSAIKSQLDNEMTRHDTTRHDTTRHENQISLGRMESGKKREREVGEWWFRGKGDV